MLGRATGTLSVAPVESNGSGWRKNRSLLLPHHPRRRSSPFPCSAICRLGHCQKKRRTVRCRTEPSSASVSAPFWVSDSVLVSHSFSVSPLGSFAASVSFSDAAGSCGPPYPFRFQMRLFFFTLTFGFIFSFDFDFSCDCFFGSAPISLSVQLHFNSGFVLNFSFGFISIFSFGTVAVFISKF